MIYFFRHGETYWNYEHRYQGAMNSYLTPKGIEQIEVTCKTFANVEKIPKPIEVYVSPLGRAIETANILSKYIDSKLIKDDRLKEVSLGSWDGKTRDEINDMYPHVLYDAKPYNWHFFLLMEKSYLLHVQESHCGFKKCKGKRYMRWHMG